MYQSALCFDLLENETMSEMAPEQLKVTNSRGFVTSFVNTSPIPRTNKIVLAYVNVVECPCMAFVDMDKDWVETL
jgi:hypothetical protein